jgi:hypothetical protein
MVWLSADIHKVPSEEVVIEFGLSVWPAETGIEKPTGLITLRVYVWVTCIGVGLLSVN